MEVGTSVGASVGAGARVAVGTGSVVGADVEIGTRVAAGSGVAVGLEHASSTDSTKKAVQDSSFNMKTPPRLRLGNFSQRNEAGPAGILSQGLRPDPQNADEFQAVPLGLAIFEERDLLPPLQPEQGIRTW